MDNENRHHKNNGTGNGFWLGVIVGVIVTLLFTTKKGREVLKDLTEKGLEKFSDIEKSLEKREAEFDEFEENDYVNDQQEPRTTSPEAPKQEVRYLASKEPATHHTQKAEAHHEEQESNGSPIPKKKRIIPKFFSRGAKKN